MPPTATKSAFQASKLPKLSPRACFNCEERSPLPLHIILPPLIFELMESCSYQPMLRDIQAIAPPARLGPQECVPKHLFILVSKCRATRNSFLPPFLV